MFQILPTVWAILALLVVLFCGIVARLTHIAKPEHIAPLNKFIFTFCLPCLIFKNVATRSFHTLNWHFVLMFLMVRGIAAVIAAVYTLIRRENMGDFAEHYLAPTWIDVVTFGIPILTAMFGPSIGSIYPVLAAFSSFIFELPIILISYQIFAAKQSLLKEAAKNKEEQESNDEPINVTSEETAKLTSEKTEPDEEITTERLLEKGNGSSDVQINLPWSKIMKVAGVRLLKTPALLGMILGLIWSAIGWTIPTVLSTVLTNLGNCVTPVATFCVGIFITDGGPFKRVWHKTIIYMVLKMVAMPLLAALCCVIVLPSATNEASNDVHVAGVVIASLPLAFPAFTFAKEFGHGEDVMATCIAVGIILILPVVIAWAYIAQFMFPSPNSSSSSDLITPNF